MSDNDVTGFSVFNQGSSTLERVMGLQAGGTVHHIDDADPADDENDVDEGVNTAPSVRRTNGSVASRAFRSQSPWRKAPEADDGSAPEPVRARFRASPILGRPKDAFSKQIENEVARTGVGVRRLYDMLDPALKARYPADHLVPLCIDIKHRDALTPEIIAAVKGAYQRLPDKGELGGDVAKPATAIRHGVKDGQHFTPSSDADLPLPRVIRTDPASAEVTDKADPAAAMKAAFTLAVDRLGRVEVEAFREMAHKEKDRTGLGAAAVYALLEPELREKYNKGKLVNSFTKGVPLRWIPVDLALGVHDVYSQQPDRSGAPMAPQS